MTSKLYFRLGDMEGFTSNKVSNEYEGWTVPIRELLQNSLDASPEGSECKINIYIESIKTSDIPHIEDYKEVLEKAIKTQRKKDGYNANSEQRVKFIKNALNKDKLQVLMFVDNGSGMDPDTMNGLFDERSHDKNTSSTGSYGVGHLTSYPLSSLSYILYATKYRDEHGLKNLFTGSPILAGHEDDEAERSNKGRILQDIPLDEKKPKFIFPEEFPPFIRSKMDVIKETGSLVAILGLSDPWDVDAEYAIVSNYFHAIAHDGLSITIYSSAGEITISDDNIEKLINDKKDETARKRNSNNVLSGRAVYQAWQTVKSHGSQKTIILSSSDKNKPDKVNVCIKTDSTFYPTIVLVRNGMVIARHDSMFSTAPAALIANEDYEKFTAVIDVSKKFAPKLFDLVKNAESPHHNKLQSKHLDTADKKQLKTLIKELIDGIKEHLTKKGTGQRIVPLFMAPDKHTGSQYGVGVINSQSKRGKSQSSNKTIKRKKKKRKVKPNGRKAPTITSRRLESRPSIRYEDLGDTWMVYINDTPEDYEPSKDKVVFSIYLGEDSDQDKVSTYLEFESVEVNNKPVEVVNNTEAELIGLRQGKSYNVVAEVKKPPSIGDMTVSLLAVFSLKQRKKLDKPDTVPKE